MQDLEFDFLNKIITVPLPDTSLDLQYLVNQARDAEDNAVPGMAYGSILMAYGKQSLGEGVYVGITVVLLDTWRVKFADRPGLETIAVRISGGNLVNVNGTNPVAPSAYTQVTLANSSSATISDAESSVTAGDIANIASAVWDEVISASAHATAQSAGKTLRDTKTRATLASLK
jgi:hypothetical protein